MSFRIGAVERVKTLKSTEPPSTPEPKMTSLTGRLGMSCWSQEKSATEILVKLGRHVDANVTSWPDDPFAYSLLDVPVATSVRLG